MNKVSIVMATYNGETYIREQLDSLLQNTFTDWQLEICDDGSKDNTLLIAREYESKYPGKIIIHANEKNLGVVLNFLEGAKRATGEYVMFCDQDDVWLPNKIEHTLNFLQRQEKKYGNDMPITVFTDAKVVNRTLEETHPSFHQSGKLDCTKLDLPHILMENKLLGCTVMFNSKVKEKLVQLPEHARVHDWWIGLVTASFGKIAYLQEATMLYRQHEKNVIGNQNFLSYVSNRIHSLKKQKQVLKHTEEQAMNFYQIYKKDLNEQARKQIYSFAHLYKRNWIQRRYFIVKYGYLKTGTIRNIGVLLLI
jgi:Glycosyltransferases involved in cell wall biogenesis